MGWASSLFQGQGRCDCFWQRFPLSRRGTSRQQVDFHSVCLQRMPVPFHSHHHHQGALLQVDLWAWVTWKVLEDAQHDLKEKGDATEGGTRSPPGLVPRSTPSPLPQKEREGGAQQEEVHSLEEPGSYSQTMRPVLIPALGPQAWAPCPPGVLWALWCPRGGRVAVGEEATSSGSVAPTEGFFSTPSGEGHTWPGRATHPQGSSVEGRLWAADPNPCYHIFSRFL